MGWEEGNNAILFYLITVLMAYVEMYVFILNMTPNIRSNTFYPIHSGGRGGIRPP